MKPLLVALLTGAALAAEADSCSFDGLLGQCVADCPKAAQQKAGICPLASQVCCVRGAPTPAPSGPTPPPTPPVPTPAPGYVRPTRLLPVDGTIVHGAGQMNVNDDQGWFTGYRNGDPDPLNWPGKGPNGTTDVYGWLGGFNPYSQYLSKDTRPSVFMLYWAPTWPVEKYAPFFANLTKILDTYGDDQYVGVQVGLWFYGFDADVAAGKYDAQIAELVKGFAALQRPVWLRIGYEFNGAWTKFSPEPFKAAWVRITKAMRANRVTNRTVANVWDYTADAPVAPDGLVKSWYPGDEWVDWWGVNVFSGVAAPDSQWVNGSNGLGFLQAAAARGFPVMFGESTPRQNPMKWEPWFESYVSLMHDPALTVRAFNYINWDWSKASPPPGMNWGNCRIEGSAVAAQWQAEMKTPGKYFHARSKADMFKGLGIDLDDM